jgi:biopolymer transport protein ExbB
MAELASIGSTAPFIGLFGTVWGIMVALQEISASGQASIDIVAGPIGEALIATAVGIAAALPAVFFYNYFIRRLKVWVTEIDTFTDAFLRLSAKQIKK